MEQIQLIRSTTQFKNQLTLLEDEHHEVLEKQNDLIKLTNQQIEEPFGSQPKFLALQLVQHHIRTFSMVSPIRKPTSYFMNKNIEGNLCASAETTLKFDTAAGVVNTKT